MSEELQQTDAVEPVRDTLLDSAEPVLEQGQYYLSEGIKGVGEKPDWLNDRYKSV